MVAADRAVAGVCAVALVVVVRDPITAGLAAGLLAAVAVDLVLARRRRQAALAERFRRLLVEPVVPTAGPADVVDLGRRAPAYSPAGTCDWGDCDQLASGWRWDDDHGWLPVCSWHGLSSRRPRRDVRRG